MDLYQGSVSKDLPNGILSHFGSMSAAAWRRGLISDRVASDSPEIPDVLSLGCVAIIGVCEHFIQIFDLENLSGEIEKLGARHSELDGKIAKRNLIRPSVI